MKAALTPEEELSLAWDSYLHKICSNIRQLGLLLNDFAVAAPMIADEVNREDLLKIVAVQRFNPELYKAIYNHSDFVTYGQNWFKNPTYVPEDIRKKRDEEALAELESSLEASSSPEAYRDLLVSLFPSVEEKLRGAGKHRGVFRNDRGDVTRAKRERRICHPDYFSAYFRYQVPDSIIGSRVFAAIVGDIRNSKDESSVRRVIAGCLKSFPGGTAKRYDFLERLEDFSPTDVFAEWVCFALSTLSAELQYDIMDIGEAALALDFLEGVANRLNAEARATFLCESLARASDDTFALRILERTYPRQGESNVKILLEGDDQSKLVRAFRNRMVRRYGSKQSPKQISIETSDPRAFWRWAKLSPNDHALSLKFWRRYVAQDKDRLADIVAKFFLRFGWSESPAPFVNMIFSDRYLKHALDRFKRPRAPQPAEFDAAIRWLEKYVAGAFATGVSPFWNDVG